jgi:beta-galactosidase/beta-glucuronidase
VLGLFVLALAAVAIAAPGDQDTGQSIVAPPHGGLDTIYAGPGGRVLLDGLWRFKRDRKVIGLDKGFQRGRFSGELVKLPFVPDARKIEGRRGIAIFRGTVGWYRTNFSVTKAGRYAIGFESVNHKAQVFIDGKRVATHVGEYLPFEARVDLQPGRRHTLVVRADWRSPTRMKRDGWHRLWFNFGGINRNVTIRPIGASELREPTLRTRLREDGSAQVDVTVGVRNHAGAREIPVKGTLTNGDRTIDLTFEPAQVGARRAQLVGAQTVITDPKLWSPEQPNLWNLQLEVPGESSYRARVGLREVRTQGKDLLLNGKRIKLRGASIHEDVFGRGDALLPTDQDRIVIGLKALNANATRSQHPIHPALLERLDAAGVMVWQGVGPTDAPGAWTSRGPKRIRTAKDRVRTTLRQAQLHPSIITWNLANEVAGGGHPTGQIPYVDSMAAELKRRDPSRPIALDIWGAHPPKQPSRIYRNIDMIGWTNYIGWYESTYASRTELVGEIRQRLAQLRRVFPQKVIAVTEFGAEANGRNPTNDPGGYDFQRDLLGLHLRTYESVPDLSGALVWNLRDFAVAPSFAGGSISQSVPDIKLVRGVNQKGLYDQANRAKPSVREVAGRFAAQAAAGN